MTTYGYIKKAGANEAQAVGVALPVSRKTSFEVANFIRGKPVAKAKQLLEDVIKMRLAVPMSRYNKDIGHRRGMAAGRYPIKTCQVILKLLKSAESNAQFKGLSTANLVVSHIAAQRGPTSWHFGRLRRRKSKRSHIEVILSEVKETAPKKARAAKKPAEPKAAPKQAPKPVEQPKPARAAASADQPTKSALPAEASKAPETPKQEAVKK